MTRARPSTSELVLVASERQAEYEAARGARVLTLRELAQCVAELAAPELTETSPETTRLLARRTLATQPSALSLAVDDALGQLRRAGARASDLARLSGSRAALLADALRRTDSRMSELGLRDPRGNAVRAAGAIEATSIRDLEGVVRVRVRGISHWENAELALIEALHRKLRLRAGGVLIELPTVPEHCGSLLRDAVAQSAARFEQRWAQETDHPELEFVEMRPGAATPVVIRAANEVGIFGMGDAEPVSRVMRKMLSNARLLEDAAYRAIDG